MGDHARYSGSGASRWLNCIGSTALLDTVPASPETEYAEEGKLAHAFAAYFLENWETNALDHIGNTLTAEVGAKPLTEEMARAIQVYLDAVYAELSKTPDNGATMLVEKTFGLVPDLSYGTSDCLIYHPGLKRLAVFDYKHGAGVAVAADDNDQAKFYATTASYGNAWPIAEVEVFIVQPRTWNDLDNPVKRWLFDTADLMEFRAEALAAIEAGEYFRKTSETRGSFDLVASTQFEPFKTGPWCKWCDAAWKCEARKAEIVAAAGFGDVSLETLADTVDTYANASPSQLDMVQLAKAIEAGEKLQAWLNQCRDYMQAIMLAGTEVPGYKVVEKVGRAKWISDEHAVAAYLRLMFDMDLDLVLPRKLETITNVEKLMKQAGAKKDDIDSFKLEHTIKESSGLTIAPDSDKRQAVNVVQRSFSGVVIDEDTEV